ncbi:Peroxiredoxin-2E-2, chloroplastic [Morella rubra]|uniref:Peroxiredoxin-2E-2, chloroplastic n=1 Tax=Morella rubra TaxID=262757 RepID=A0A6A1W7N2_9ROSI|nr:Peroxiredoxin-2E-2, chloroplastic [Morella rubra]
MAASLSVSRLLLSSPTAPAMSTKTSLFPSAKTPSSKPSFASLPCKLHHQPKPLKFSTTTKSTISAAVSVGDKLPEATLSYFDPAGELQTTTISDLTKNKKAILFAT